jgi:hypothetical protein
MSVVNCEMKSRCLNWCLFPVEGVGHRFVVRQDDEKPNFQNVTEIPHGNHRLRCSTFGKYSPSRHWNNWYHSFTAKRTKTILGHRLTISRAQNYAATRTMNTVACYPYYIHLHYYYYSWNTSHCRKLRCNSLSNSSNPEPSPQTPASSTECTQRDTSEQSPINAGKQDVFFTAYTMHKAK